MKNRMLRALGANEDWVATAIDMTEALSEATLIRPYSAAVAEKLGEMLLEAAFMAGFLKDGKASLSLDFQSMDGSTHLFAFANGELQVKAMAVDPAQESIAGNGTLTVLKDLGLRTPYNSQILGSLSDIAGTLDDYYERSEQLFTHSRLYVEFDENGKPVHCLGLFLQALPGASTEAKKEMAHRFYALPEIPSFLRLESPLEGMLAMLFEGMDEKESAEREISWHCECSQERCAAILETLPEEDLADIVAQGEDLSITCGFCGKTHIVPIDTVEGILAKKKTPHKA